MKSPSPHFAPGARRAAACLPQQRIEMIQFDAYRRVARESWHGGNAIDEWLKAKSEIDRMLQGESVESLSAIQSFHQSFQQKLETQLNELDADLDGLKAKAQGLDGEIRSEYETQLDTLIEKWLDVHEKLQDLSQHTEDAWEDLKKGLIAWADMRVEMERIDARFK